MNVSQNKEGGGGENFQINKVNMSWAFVRESTPKARKAHTCDLCFLPIPQGQVHVARVGSDCGLFTFRMHLECERVTRGWESEDWESKTDGYEFRQELEEYRGRDKYKGEV